MNTIETHILELIGENTDSPDVFTDDSTGMAPIRDSINDAIEEISLLTGGHRIKWFVPLTSGNAFYQLESDRDLFAWPVSVWLVNQKKRLTQKDFGWLQNYNPRFLFNSGSPERYCPIWTDKIMVHPVPSADGDVLEIDGVSIPLRYEEDTDRVKLRDEYRWAVVHYAVGEYWASRGEVKSAIEHHNEYLKRIGMQELYPTYGERRYGLANSKSEN